MLIKKIIIKNIRSYENAEIEFPEGSTMLTGDIGAGKTSILLAIEFGLFGLQPGQKGTALLRNGADEGSVKLEIEVEEQKIIVERTLKRKKSVSQDYCFIDVAGDQRELAVTELKNKILEILNYPQEFAKKQNLLYKFTVYTPQEEMKQIILEDSKTRLNTLRHVFGIDKYKRVLENASVLLSKIREEKRIKEALTATLQSDRDNIISKENNLEEKKKELTINEGELIIKKDRRENVQKEIEEVSKKREEKIRLQQEMEKSKIMASTKRDTISENQKLILQLNIQIEEIQKTPFSGEEREKLEKEISNLKEEKEIYSEKIINISSQINSLQLKNSENESTREKITHIEVCPTCLQDVGPTYKQNVVDKFEKNTRENNQKISELTNEKISISQKILESNNQISLREKRINELNLIKLKYDSIEEKKKRIEDLEKNNLSLNKDIELLDQQVTLLKASFLELTKFENIFLEKSKELEISLREEKISEIKVAELKKEIELSMKQIEELRERVKKTEEIIEQVVYLAKLEDWIVKQFIPATSIVEKNVMTKLKTEFSNLFANWFGMLVPESFNVRLSDDFTPVIEQQDYELDYAYLSGGERTAIALAYRLALNQVINSLLSKIKTRDIVILDEPTDGFSEQQLDKMRDVLMQMNARQLIIVSHEPKIESFVENIIKFKKEKGITQIEEALQN